VQLAAKLENDSTQLQTLWKVQNDFVEPYPPKESGKNRYVSGLQLNQNHGSTTQLGEDGL